MNSFRNHLNNNHGGADSKAPTIIIVIVLIIVALLCLKFIPVKVRAMKFGSELQEVINPNMVKPEKITPEILIKKIQKIAKQFKIPKLDPKKNITIKKIKQQRYSVTVKYTEIISIPIYGEYVWPFEFKATQLR